MRKLILASSFVLGAVGATSAMAASTIPGPYAPGQLSLFSGVVTRVHQGTAAAQFCTEGGCAGFSLINKLPNGQEDLRLDMANLGMFQVINAHVGQFITVNIVNGGTVDCAPSFCNTESIAAQALDPVFSISPVPAP